MHVLILMAEEQINIHIFLRLQIMFKGTLLNYRNILRKIKSEHKKSKQWSIQ